MTQRYVSSIATNVLVTFAYQSKVYRDINHGKTDFNFVYYPQFWLSAQKRPVFEKAMQQLLDMLVQIRFLY